LAVNKPGGLPTLPGGGFMENTLLRLVQKQNPNANPVHRLGRGTTGIVLFAKTPQAAAKLSADWNTPRIQKIYWALAQGIAQHDAYEILTPIGLVPHPRIGSVWAASPSGKPSKSLAKVISRAPSSTASSSAASSSTASSTTVGTTTFEVRLNSGRPHQIRIHLASIGHPLVGDPLYGLSGQPLENLPGLPGDGGYLLHAQFLNFHHPITGEQINLEAALPSGFSLHQLGGKIRGQKIWGQVPGFLPQNKFETHVRGESTKTGVLAESLLPGTPTPLPPGLLESWG
jgi:23S rRNA pseudouridine1911/1915/1917 synthase